MAERNLHRPNDASAGRFSAPPLPGRNLEPLSSNKAKDGLRMSPVPSPPKSRKSIRAPERLAERLKGGHVRGMLARAGLRQIVEEQKVEPGRWSHNGRGLFTELVQVTQGSSMSDLLVALTRVKALEVEHWPESIKATEKLELLRSLQNRLQSALSCSNIEEIEMLLQSVAVGIRSHPDFCLLVAAVEQRLQKLRSLRRELRCAARSSDVILLAGSLRMADELEVRSNQAATPWKEVEVAEVRLKVLHALIAKMTALLGIVGEVDEAIYLEVLGHASRVVEDDPPPPIGSVLKAVREQFQQRFGHDYSPTVAAEMAANRAQQDASAGVSNQQRHPEATGGELQASAGASHEVPVQHLDSAGSLVFEDDLDSGEQIMGRVMQSELAKIRLPISEDEARPAEPVLHREPGGNEDAYSSMCQQLVDDLVARELEDVGNQNHASLAYQSNTPRPVTATSSADTVLMSIVYGATSQGGEHAYSAPSSLRPEPEPERKDGNVLEDDAGRSSRAIADGLVHEGLRPLVQTPSAETVPTSGRQSANADSRASQVSEQKLDASKGSRVNPGSCIPSAPSREAKSSVATLPMEESGASLVGGIVQTELENLGEEESNVMLNLEEESNAASKPATSDAGTFEDVVFQQTLQDQLAVLHVPDEEDAADAEVAEVLSKACSAAWLEDRGCSSVPPGRQSGLSPVAEVACPPASPTSRVEESLAEEAVQSALRDAGEVAISDGGSSRGSDVVASQIAGCLAWALAP
ncbi:unnamed protein product [Symbiodinium sp. CCMP2592]|nr:unnamed protein product [Symbiodinium sp. CCMP2592]